MERVKMMRILSGWNASVTLHSHLVHRNKQRFLLETDQYDTWVMFALEEGSFYYEIADKRGLAKAGDIVVCPAHTLFRRKVVSTLMLHFILFSWEAGEDHIDASDSMVGMFPDYLIRCHEPGYIQEILQIMRELPDMSADAEQQWKAHLLNQIWCRYMLQQSQQTEQQQWLMKESDPLMRKVKIFIEEQACTNQKMKEVSDAFFMSPVQLSRRYKATYGVTPSDYLLSLRMEKAKALLIETDQTIHQVAISCGYDNGFYFSRVFTRDVGIAPSIYRKQHLI